MMGMYLIIELILAMFLEKKTLRKKHRNSSIPPLQKGKDQSALSHQGSNDKGKKENHTLAKNTLDNQQVTIAMALKVAKC